MNILPTAYAPRQGESLGKHSLQKIDAIPEEVRSAIDDGLNDIRFNGYRWECNAKTGWARVSPISSPADAEPESPEQSQANARADFLALQGEYLSVTQETKSEKKSATDIVNELRSKAAKTSHHSRKRRKNRNKRKPCRIKRHNTKRKKKEFIAAMSVWVRHVRHLSEVVARIKLKLQPGAYYPALHQQQESRMMDLMYLKFARQK